MLADDWFGHVKEGATVVGRIDEGSRFKSDSRQGARRYLSVQVEERRLKNRNNIRVDKYLPRYTCSLSILLYDHLYS